MRSDGYRRGAKVSHKAAESAEGRCESRLRP